MCGVAGNTRFWRHATPHLIPSCEREQSPQTHVTIRTILPSVLWRGVAESRVWCATTHPNQPLRTESL